jgi:hypothetical protein
VTTPSLAQRAGSSPAPIAIAERVATLDWAAISPRLDASGCATTGALLAPAECAALAQTYDADAHFRSRVVMARHGFGSGEYKYFSYPLPDLVAELREALYPRLAEIADRWNEAMDVDVRYPRAHADYLKRCHCGGQTKPTPLLLRYDADDYNCLHQDLYGELVFPLQVIWRGGDLPGASSSGARHARDLPGQYAARREPRTLWPPAHAGRHFP